MRKPLLCAVALTLAFSSSAVAQRDTVFSWSKRLPANAKLSIRNLNGPIDVRAGTTDQVEIRATIRSESKSIANALRIEARDKAADEFEICTTDRGIDACIPEESWSDNHVSVQYTVDLPKGLRLRATTTNGDVIVMQTVNLIDVTTGNGDIVIRESLGEARAGSGSGHVTIAMANGPVRASSGNGDVRVNTFLGPVDASSGNGDVDVRMITVAPIEGRVMTVTSGNGDVKVTLPADFNGGIDASTGHKKLINDFEVHSQGRDYDRRIRGTIGNGVGPTIRANSGNGRVEIRKG